MYFSSTLHVIFLIVIIIIMMCLSFPIAKLVPVGYGINKLTISCVVEDDKVTLSFVVMAIITLVQIGTDDLEEAITAFDDHVQSVDVAAFNKI